MKLTKYDEKTDTLYINSEAIILQNASIADCMCHAMRKSYRERISESKYCNDILEELEKHPGCNIAEFTNYV